MRECFRNDGQGDNFLQNTFTSYLQTALQRASRRYWLIRKRTEVTEQTYVERALTASPDLRRTSVPVDELVQLQFDVRQALAALPELERSIVCHKIFDDMTFRDIGAVIGKNENTVKTAYYRALRLLREVLS